MRLALLTLGWASLAAGCVTAQEAPRAAIRYEAPSVGLVSARYECRGTPVNLELRSTARSVAIARFTVGDESLSAAELARWNAGLSSVEDFLDYGFSCLGERFQAVSVRGRTANEQSVTIVAEWREGRLYVDPPIPTR